MKLTSSSWSGLRKPETRNPLFGEPCSWSGGASSIVVWLLPRVLELTYTAWDLEPFAQDCGWPGPPFRWDEERRFLLRCELDAAFFHLYLPAEANGDWRPADGETAADLARLKTSFPTPREAHPEVNWRSIIGLRNVLVHDYLGINLERIWDIIERDVPDLQRTVEAILREPDGMESGQATSDDTTPALC